MSRGLRLGERAARFVRNKTEISGQPSAVRDKRESCLKINSAKGGAVTTKNPHDGSLAGGHSFADGRTPIK
jgi:hypothetical protein